MADGTIKIDIDIPVNKVKSDSHAVNEELERIGKNAGKDMDSSFKKNADSVKREAKSTSESIDKSIGREHKTKIKVDSSEAKTKINETKHDLDEIPKKHETKVDADASQFNRKVDEAKRKTNELPKKHNTDIDATDHTGGVFARIKSHFDGINERGEKTHSLFKTIFSANVISNAATSAFGAVKGALGGMYQEAKQYALEQQTMNATWLTLTNSASKGQAMVKQINNMAVAAQNSTEMVDQLSQKFYAINNNAKQTGELTKSILTLQDAFGQTDAAVENFGTQFSQMMANGKVSAQDMMSIVNTFPKLRPMLLDYERRIHHNSHMTMQEMNKMMSDGKIKSQDMINVVLEAGKKFNKATGNFTKTIPGMTRVVKSQMPVLLGAFTKPLAKMESPVYAAVAKWVSSKKTNKEFQNLGKTVSTGMNSVMKAFSGGKTVNVTKALDSAINGINKGLKGVFGWISGHAKDLKTIASSVASIGGQIAKAVWKDFASIITTIGNMLGITAKNGKKSGGAIHVLAEALNWLSKQRWAIHAIAASIVTIATVKSFDHVAGGLFSIGKKGYRAYRNIKALYAGIKGVQDIKDFKKTEQGFYTIGQQAKGAYEWVKSLFGAGKNAGKLTGVLQSVHSAGGFKGLSTAGKIATGVAGAGVVADAGYNAIFKAFQDRHSATKRSQDIGKGIGAGIGGGIGLWFGGPLGAAVGAKVGEVVGKWGGEAVNKFTKGWQSKKPPKSFWSLANLGWSAHSMWNGFTSSVGKTIKWFKKNWREIGSFLTHPVLESIRLLSKNKGFQKWVKKTANDMHKGWKQGVEKSHKVMAKFWSNTAKGWNKMWKSINSNRYVKAFKKGKFFSTALKDMKSRFSAFNKWLSQKWSSMWREVNSNRYVKAFKKGKFFSTALKDIRSRWNSFTSWFGKNWHNFWRSTNKHAHSSWSDTVKKWHSFTKSINTGWKSFKDSFKSSWNGFWHGLENTVKSWGKTIKDDFTGTVNNIIGGFNDVVHALGGKKKTIGFLHFATGTDWQNRWGVPAILNDGNDSPQTNNRESLIYPDGTWELLPNKRNLKRILPFGTDVVNARDTANLASRFMHYADGTLDLEDLNVSKSQENVLKKLLRINSKQLQVVVEEAHRKRDRDRKQAQRQKSKDHKSKKSKPLKITIDNKKRKGSVLVDKGLLTGSLKETGQETWVNEKLFKRLMSYTKAKPIKVSKNSRIRYRAIPTRRNSKGQYLVDSKWLTGAKKNTGKLEALTRDAYLKLLQFTKAERKYKLPKKRRKTTTHRRSTRRASTRRYSTGSSISSVATHVSASVSGIKSVNALAKAVKAIKGKHKITIKAKASGSKSINKLARSVKKVAGKHKVTIKTKGLKSLKSLYKAAKRIKGSTHRVKVKTSGIAGLKKLRSAISSVASESKKATKSIKGEGNFAKAFASLAKSTDKSLSKLRSNAEKDFKNMWSNLRKNTSSGTDKIDHDVKSFDGKFKKQWTSLTNGAERIFDKFWKSMKSKARSGLNDVIGVLNEAISKIDNVIGQFGGSKSAVHRVARLATGTGALGGVRRPITAPTLAILNDGFDSPETNNQEAIWDRNTGNVEVVPGRFTPRILKPGQEVFNATETAMLGYTTPQHFATGTGALKELYHIAKHNWEHPQKTGQALFSAVTGLTGAINQLAQGARKKGENQGVKWWSQLWKMVDDKVNGDDIEAKGLLKAVEKYGEGHKYVWGASGPTTFDCSGLVMYALKHKYGISFPHFSGSQYDLTEHIPKSQAKMGDLVFWGKGGSEHVGVYAGHNQYFSAQSPSQGIHMNSLNSVVGYGKPLFGRVRGLKQETSGRSVKADNALQKLIRKQVWNKGFTKTIEKIAEKYGEEMANPAGDGVARWRDAVKKALSMNHLSTSDSMVNRVLRQMATESNGDPHARQPGSDPDGDGSGPALGLMQTKRATFEANKFPGHGNLWNGFDNLLAALRYAKHRYGSSLYYLGQGHGYARGGIVSKPEIASVGEGNAPESIIPWDPAYRGRALAIMQATLDHFMAQDGKSQRYQSQAQQAVDLSKTNAEIEAINEKFDAALAQLGILTSKNEVIQLTNTLDKRVIGEAMYAVTKNKLQRDIRNEAYRISGHH